MIINITHKTTIRNIQEKMRVAYPFLKIEFCGEPYLYGNKSTNNNWFNHDSKLLDIARKQQKGWIVLHPWYKTDFVRQTFEDRFGLHVQFFRKQEDDWIEIAGTDVFTIDEQNEIGRRLVERNHAPSWRERELLL